MRSAGVVASGSLVAVVVLGACSAQTPPDATSTLSPDPTAAPVGDDGDRGALPERSGPRHRTTGDVPHMQTDADPVPEIDEELRRRVFQLPGVENRASAGSLPGARGLAFADDVELAKPDVIAGGREFAHIHPDRSLHVWLSVDRAAEVDRTKWGELHPWVGQAGFWNGVAMVYTPETSEELEIAIRIVVDGYNFATGASLEPADIP